MKYKIEHHNMDGCGSKRYRVYYLPSIGDYWTSVTDIICPTECGGMIRWHEAGFVPGYRICTKCLKHFLAIGSNLTPKLVRMGQRVG